MQINYEKVLDPKIEYNLYLVTDASKVGVGSFLYHAESFEKAKQNIAAIHSRKVTPAQCNYSTTDQEMLAIIDALRTFEHKLHGVKFTIITDHMVLRTLITQTVKNQQRIRWLEDMTMFDFDIQHIQGEENILADALSRIYDGMDADEIVDQDYLKEEENYINMDTFLPVDPPSTQYMPCNIYKHNSFAIATLNRHTTPPVIPTPPRENVHLQDLEDYPMYQENGWQSPELEMRNTTQQD